MQWIYLLGETCFKMFWEHCALSTIILVKGNSGSNWTLMKKYLIPQMVPSIWESIFGLLSIVSVAWPKHIKPHWKSNFMSEHLERAIPQWNSKGANVHNRLIEPIGRCLRHCYVLRMWLWWVRTANSGTWTNFPLEFSLCFNLLLTMKRKIKGI